MITLLIGENSFEITRATKALAAAFDGRAEKIDGAGLQINQLGDLFMGSTLFAEKRLVIIKNVSENKPIWTVLETWLSRVSSDVHIVLVEPKPDKRTKTFKALQKTADVKDFPVWTERDSQKAESWVAEEAHELGFSLDKGNARLLVQRVGVDQWLLYQALQKLVVAGEITPGIIEELIEANPVENVFNLFEAALSGDMVRVKHMVETLQLSEDPYRLFGLMSGQAFHLLTLTLTDKSSAEIAKDFGAHPFALSKLAPHAKTLGRAGTKKVFTIFIEADAAMKTSAADPWLLIERALIKIAVI
jgi:DNA polymerase III delta subunit